MENRFKFRVWYNPQCEYLQSKYFYDVQDVYDGSIDELGWICCFGDLLGDDHFIIEQCTGLKDKNGVLIYEGDIVLINRKRKQVYFFNGAFFCKDIKQYEFDGADPAPLHYWLANGYNIEVIGNVHENE